MITGFGSWLRLWFQVQKITASEAEVPRGGSVNKEGNECHGR